MHPTENTLELLGEADNRLSDTHGLTGTYQIDMKWQDGPIDKLVGKEVLVKFLPEGDAQVFDVSFEGVNSLSENIASIGPQIIGSYCHQK